MKLAIIPFLAVLSLSGCTAVEALGSATTGTITQAIPDTMNDTKKALTAAHALHKTTADFLVVAATTNLCHATCASTAKGYLDQSEAYLVAADKLVALGDAPGIEAKISAATLLISQVQGLVGQK